MKRIIDGVTYNTDTSTTIAQAEWENREGEQCQGTLYQTRGGAFFIDVETTRPVYDEYEEQWKPRKSHAFEPQSRDEAEKWCQEGEVEIFVDAFGELPEAAETETEAGVYFRLPIVLKTRIEAAAKDAGLSLNAWAMRCFERCAEPEQPYVPTTTDGVFDRTEGLPKRSSRLHKTTSGPKGSDPL